MSATASKSTSFQELDSIPPIDVPANVHAAPAKRRRATKIAMEIARMRFGPPSCWPSWKQPILGRVGAIADRTRAGARRAGSRATRAGDRAGVDAAACVPLGLRQAEELARSVLKLLGFGAASAGHYHSEGRGLVLRFKCGAERDRWFRADSCA